MRAVGCDSDTKLVALAVELPNGWETYLAASPRTAEDLKIIMDWLRLAAGEDSELHFVAENTFMYNNAKTTIRLAQARGRIESAALLAGYVVHDAVNNEVWKRTQLGVHRGVPRERAKAISLERARLVSGKNITDHNIADAMGIAHWLAGQVDLQRRLAHGIL